jgi:hypothetical protein
VLQDQTKMNKNSNEIFVGEFNVSVDGCNVDERSESSYDTSSIEDRSRKVSKRRSTKVHTTPGSAIALQPDSFRGAMNLEEVSSRNNGMLQNPGETIIKRNRAMISIFLQESPL